MTKEEEEVFGNISNEDSARDEFKRNHKNVWNFIIRKKKSVEVVDSTARHTQRPKESVEVEKKRE